MKLRTSKLEIIDLLKAWIAISIAFGIILRHSLGFTNAILVAAFSVGIGFLLHEMAHKFVAQHYHCFAEFRSFDQMLILAIAMSFFGFVFVAPGAVMIQGFVDYRKNGIISAAGPLTNIILAIVFLILLVFNIFPTISQYGFMINSWLALFNMIPVWNFDGKKILAWNKVVYFTLVAVAFFFSFIL
jgi:Zn-dependent protease